MKKGTAQSLPLSVIDWSYTCNDNVEFGAPAPKGKTMMLIMSEDAKIHTTVRCTKLILPAVQ